MEGSPVKNVRLNPVAGSIALSLFLAFLYVLTGRIGLELAVPLGYATMIWPPSGIAIGMLLLYGWRLWPGVFAGSLFLNAYISGAFNDTDQLHDPSNIVPAFFIAMGSTFQALAGWALVRKFIGLPLDIKRPRQIILMFMLCGPLSCLIAATVGAATLYLSGLLSWNDVAQNWLSWWCGDIFGILVFTPLVILSPLGGKKKLSWKGSVISSLPFLAIVTIILPIGLTFYVWKITSEKNYVESYGEFEALAQDNENALLYRMTSYSHALASGLAYFQNIPLLTRKSWNDFASSLQLQDNYPGINGMGVIYPVPPEEISSFVEKSRIDGYAMFDIRNKTPGLPNYVIKYIYPEFPNEQAIGLNIAFEQNRREAANLARDTALPAITRKITLVQDQNQSPGFLLMHPVYDRHMRRATVEQKRTALQAWIYAPFIASEFFGNLTEGQGKYFHLRIYDGTEERPEDLIYTSAGANAASHPYYRVVKKINIMQREWLAVWESTKIYDRREQSDEPLIVLVVGLSFTFIFSTLLVVFSIRRMKTLEIITREKGYLLPALVFAFAISGTFYLYNVVRERERQYIVNMVDSQSESMSSIISIDSRQIILSLRRMGERWNLMDGDASSIWEVDAKNYINDFFSLKAIAWVDSDYRIRKVYPLSGYEGQIGLSIADNAEKKAMLDAAVNKQHATVGAPSAILGGNTGFLIYVPVKKANKNDGFIVGLVSLKNFFDAIFVREYMEGYSVVISYADKVLYARDVPYAGHEKSFGHSVPFSVGDVQYTLSMSPTDEYVESNKGGLALAIAASGIAISVLLAMVTRFILVARIRAAYLQGAMKAADSANKAKSLFLSNISHEIRTPLNGVLATTELLEKTALDVKQRKYIDIIHNSGELLFNLLNDVLDLSKIEMHKLKLNDEAFNLREAIRVSVDLFAPGAGRKGLDLSLDIDPDVPEWIMGDRQRFTQVMTNLVGNAVKYTHKGSISVTVKFYNERKMPLVIEVSDTGIGIPEDLIGTIFERFSQAHALPNIEGTGLGLAICKSFVTMMGGEIGVRSVEGEGSTFRIDLPVRNAVALNASSGKNNMQSADENIPCSVLLVEDTEVNRVVISDMLAYLGCSVETAENGAVALEKIKERKYDIVFMDCNMPVMNGYDATRSIRELYGDALPVIAISAHAFSEDVQTCLKAGMNDHVQKPVKIEMLKQAIEKWVRAGETASLSSDIPEDKKTDMPVIDISYLPDWIAGDKARLEKILSLTRENALSLLDGMISAYAQKDLAELVKKAHALKSVAAQVGGQVLSSICKTIEIEGETMGEETLREAMGSLEQEGERFIRAIGQLGQAP